MSEMRQVISPVPVEAGEVHELVRYLHAVREDERAALGRQMHDELGALLVSAAIDLGWAETRSSESGLRPRLRRLGINLAGAIDLKRKIIEQLRPTLLDNFGLFEAMRWYFKNACHHARAVCTQSYPNAELPLTSIALSNIFRSVQTLLDCTFAEDDLSTVMLEASIEGDQLCIRLSHEHTAMENVDVLKRFRNELASAAYRVADIYGELSFEPDEKGSAFGLRLKLADVCL